jgi:hypothetical protein
MNWDRAKSVPWLVGLAVLLGSFALYLATLAPTLTWGWEDTGVDGGELLAAAHTLGVPHPPGYPTYMLLLKAFATVVPLGDMAFRGNLLSAVLASAAALVIYWVIVRLALAVRPTAPGRLIVTGAALGAAVFASSPLLWSQAVITEVYALNTLFAALLLLIASGLALRRPSNRRSRLTSPAFKLALFGLVLGVGLGNHLTLLAVAVPLLYWIWKSLGWRRLASPWAVAAFVVGLSVYVYLPIRAAQAPPINWGNADTLRGATWMLSAQPYQEYVFGIDPGNIVSRMFTWTELVFTQFNPLGLFIGLMALRGLRLALPGFLVASLTSILLISGYSVMYASVDSEVLMVPAFLLFAVWVGIGFVWIADAWVPQEFSGAPGSGRLRSLASRPVLVLGVLAFVLLPAVSVALNFDSQDLSDDRSAYDHARQIIDSVPDGSVIVSNEERNVFSLWYMRYVATPRRDVAVIAAPLLQFDWYLDQAHEMFPARVPEIETTDIQEAIDQIVDHNRDGPRVFSTFRNSAFDATGESGLYEATADSGS